MNQEEIAKFKALMNNLHSTRIGREILASFGSPYIFPRDILNVMAPDLFIENGDGTVTLDEGRYLASFLKDIK